ncbi:Cholesterol 25-hydroxylase-like protein, partial [Gonapodya sp. JEL0774]
MAYTINDFFFYVLHRCEHEIPYLYKYWHKRHHEFKVTNVGATSWNYWQESMGIMVCAELSAMIVGLSLFEYLIYLVVGIWGDAHVHIGYRLPWNIMNLWNPPEWHDFHHYKNVGNYAAGFTFWDVVFGTDRHYREYVARNEELARKGLAEDEPNLD